MSTTILADIQAKIAELEAQAQKLRDEAAAEWQKVTATVIEEVRAKIAEYGLSAKDLGLSTTGSTKQVRKGAVSKPTSVKAEVGTIYKGPNGETWTAVLAAANRIG